MSEESRSLVSSYSRGLPRCTCFTYIVEVGSTSSSVKASCSMTVAWEGASSSRAIAYSASFFRASLAF